MNFSEIAKTATLNHMADYLKATGRPTKGFFTCLSMQLGTPNAHPDSHPSMNYNRKNGTVHCHQCNLTLDLLDLIEADNNINSKMQALDKARQMFPDIPELTEEERQKGHPLNWNDVISNKQTEQQDIKPTQDPEEPQDSRTEQQIKEDEFLFKACAKNCAENPDGVREWAKRGISTGTIERFHLGYESNYPHFIQGDNFKGFNAQILSIPSLETPGAGVLRNINASIEEKKHRYDTKGPKQLYNKTAIYNQSDYIFITEGEIDGLSIYEAGYDSFISLGGIQNKGQLINLLNKPDTPSKTLIMLLDNDSPGQSATDTIIQWLSNQTKHFVFVPTGFYPDGVKDINEFLLSDPEGLRTALKRSIDEAQQQKEAGPKERAEQYTKDNSILSVIDAFKNNLGRADTTPIYRTGLLSLDHHYLNGGLHGQSLIIIGALSSAGKTTFIQQIADNIAQSGRDVMMFSLEMSKTELIAKSISRLTYLKAIENSIDTKNAKTVFGITDGERYINYRQEEIDLIYNATEHYKEHIAPNMYIFEGAGNVTVVKARADQYDQPSIRDRIEKHVEITGRYPVVIVDYLQILAPYNERATDKQNTDKNVLELKRIARDFNIPVIAISSMNRDSYNEPISLKSFKESGAVEYSSDVLLGLQFKGQSDKSVDKKGKITRPYIDIEEEKTKDPRKMELKLLKNRNGPIPKEYIYYDFLPKFGYFKELGIKRANSQSKEEENKPDQGPTIPQEKPVDILSLFKGETCTS